MKAMPDEVESIAPRIIYKTSDGEELPTFTALVARTIHDAAISGIYVDVVDVYSNLAIPRLWNDIYKPKAKTYIGDFAREDREVALEIASEMIYETTDPELMSYKNVYVVAKTRRQGGIPKIDRVTSRTKIIIVPAIAEDL